MWFKKKEDKKQEIIVKPQYDNAFSVLNRELERMHEMFKKERSGGGNENNLNTFWTRINTLQDAMIQALEKQPAHSDEIKDLQNTVAEILLLTQTESR